MMALAAIMLPWPGGAMAALHEAYDHSARQAELAAVLHGHHHEHQTPPHDHSLTPAGTAMSGQSRVVAAHTARAETVAQTGAPLPPPMDASAPRETASPPVRPTSSKSILRI
jgi:hypothetical protein